MANKYPYWDEYILNEFKKIFEQNNEMWINENFINQIQQKESALLESNNKYKKEFNKTKYYSLIWLGFPASILCLFIPLYWVVKEYKKLKKQKQELLGNIQQKVNEKLDLHAEIFKTINFLDIFKSFDKVIAYRNLGPISYKLIQSIKANSLFDFKKNVNTYNSSWGLLDNKIIIHSAKQTHEKYMQNYIGSVSVSYFNQASQTTETEIVTATYEHPAYKIETQMKNYMLMLSCSNLQFYFENDSGPLRSKIFNKRNEYAPLENKKFDNEYNWSRNDDAQFRMIFTPYCQEQFLLNAGTKKIDPCYEWNKTKNFIFNNYKAPNDIGNIEQYFHNYKFKFLENHNVNTKELKNEIFNFVTSFYLQIYLSFNFYWLTTILKSENHDHIIKEALNHKTVEAEDQYLFFHYALWLLNIKAVKSPNMDTFHQILYVDQFNLCGYEIFNVSFLGSTYFIVEKVVYINEHSSKTNSLTSVPVYYNDYILKTGKLDICCALIPTSYFYYYSKDFLFTNINDENILSLLKNVAKKVIIKQNVLVFDCLVDRNSLEQIINYLINPN